MKIRQITGEEFRQVCKAGKPVIVRTVGVSIHEPAVANRKITKFIQVMIFSAHKANDKLSAGKLEKGRALASMMIAKEVPVFTLETSEIEEMRKTGMSQKTGDNMPEVSGVSAVMINDEIVFCAAIGAVSSLELYDGHTTSRAAATLGSIRTPKKAEASRINGIKGGRPVVSRYAVADRPGYFGAKSRVYSTHSRKDLAIREARKSIFLAASGGERHVPRCVIAGEYMKGECIYATNFPDTELVF